MYIIHSVDLSHNTCTNSSLLMDCALLSLQTITECDLAVPTGIPGFAGGPGRLSTQVANSPPSQIQPLHVETPLNSFSSTVLSSSEVFLVDGVVVMFAGLSTGEVRKVCTVSSMCCVVSRCSVHHPCCTLYSTQLLTLLLTKLILHLNVRGLCHHL